MLFNYILRPQCCYLRTQAWLAKSFEFSALFALFTIPASEGKFGRLSLAGMVWLISALLENLSPLSLRAVEYLPPFQLYLHGLILTDLIFL